MMQLYGLKNCDTCRAAKKALASKGHEVVLHDVRDTPLGADDLRRFFDAFGADKLVNKASTTWRAMSEVERAHEPLDLLLAHPALMKRPVIDTGVALYLGWSKAVQAELLA